MSSIETIRLVFEPTLRVAGETIQGEVHLNFPGLIRDKINEVHVKLRGYVYTRISTRRVDQMEQEQRLQVPLIHENISLWEQGVGTSSYPSPGSDILIRPFSFKLPSTLLPSCEYGGLNTYVCNVRYFVQVVGRRPGKLKLNERRLVAFPVLSALTSGAKLRETFQQGWRGPWRATAQEKDVRRGIWGDHSHVKVTLDLPDIEVIPIFTSIPYSITITTHTKPMARDEGITDGSLFPIPPTKPEDVSFWLESDVFMKTKSWTANRNDNFVSDLGGLGPRKSASQQNRGQVEVQTLDKVWIPEGEKKAGRGRWKQEVVFRSMLRLNCAPSFDSETLNLRYRVKLRVDFPGIGNSLKEEFPIHIVSSIHPPEEQAWDGPPPELDLPPDYYKAASWDGDSSVLIDEKD